MSILTEIGIFITMFYPILFGLGDIVYYLIKQYFPE